MFRAGNFSMLRWCRLKTTVLLKECNGTVEKNFTHILQQAATSVQFKYYYSTNYDIVIVGAGIIGLSTAMQLQKRLPNTTICVLEKEPIICRHQTGNNSGVIHAGIYYKPDSLRARLCVEGVESLYKYCEENKIPYKKNGKLIVAVNKKELKWLDNLYDRGNQNKVPGLELMCPEEFKQIEPLCSGLKALWSPNTGIMDFIDAARHFALVFRCLGGTILCDFNVVGISQGAEGSSVFCAEGEGDDYPIRIRSADKRVVRAGVVLTCCGLQADRVAMLTGESQYPKIVPFRGEYFGMIKDKEHLIKTNIYPVPDPTIPFIGVHYTPKVDGSLWLGPTAMVAYKREGYKWNELSIRDCWDMIKFPGLWRFGFKYFRQCMYEIVRSVNTRTMYKELRVFVPTLLYKDIYKGAAAGVQAQAMNKDGTFSEDFSIDGKGRIIHCRNMPSPACTSSLAIGRYLADTVQDRMCDLKSGRGR